MSGNPQPLWFCGPSRSGKTKGLITEIVRWLGTDATGLTRSALILASTSDNGQRLYQELLTTLPKPGPLHVTNPFGFISQEVQLFWPLLARELGTPVLFPVQLRSETEQQLARQLWSDPRFGLTEMPPLSLDRVVRNQLDLFLLAAGRCDSPKDLEQHFATHQDEASRLGLPTLSLDPWYAWRDWCVERGFLTYGVMLELYHRHLLPSMAYQHWLRERVGALFVDDLQEYPGCLRLLYDLILGWGDVPAVFTSNSHSVVRLGFGADPFAFQPLLERCQRIELPDRPSSIVLSQKQSILRVLQRSSHPVTPTTPATPKGDSPQVQLIHTTLRGDLLRQVSEVIGTAVQRGEIQPQDIALITPGFEGITRYALQDLLQQWGISLMPFMEQRPLIEVPLVASLLTLLGFFYPGAGLLISRDRVAEMLMVLSYGTIDPVRAGLLADHCYQPHPDRPQLVDYHHYPRWDRLGYRVAQAYDRLYHWIGQQQQHMAIDPLDPPLCLDQAVQFICREADRHPQASLSYDQLSALRELLETAQHYWQVMATSPLPASHWVPEFIRLLRRGIITANPYPLNAPTPQAVTIATIFQYRLHHCAHPWQFWLDIGSPRWLLKQGGLSGSEWLLQGLPPSTLNPRQPLSLAELRLEQNLLDLLGRVDDRLYLCHSDLASNGHDQTGPLLPLTYTGFTPVITTQNA